MAPLVRPAALALALIGSTAFAQPAGKSSAPAGAIAVQAGPGKFDPLPANAELPADKLLALLPGATLAGTKGGVELTCRADFTGHSPIPVLETAVRLHPNPDADLEVTLDRGRIDLTNRKPDGPALVRLRLHAAKWLVTLEKPGTRVAVELCGRWPAGSRYTADPPKERGPVLSAVAIVLSGAAEIDNGQTTLALTAPPGPAMTAWSSNGGAAPGAVRVDRLPDWADPKGERTPDAVKLKGAIEKYRQLRAEAPDAAIDRMLASADPADRRVGLIAAGALDDLPRLVAAGAAVAADAEAADFAVTVFRHWLGRGAGQEQALYQHLTGPAGYSPAHAETVIALLHGFTPAELRRPETYQVLVEYLQHDKPAVRNLAHWHLVRLVPSGKRIGFKPNASKAELEPVYRLWKELVPAGRLPADVKY
jgi:hypothetical protein